MAVHWSDGYADYPSQASGAIMCSEVERTLSGCAAASRVRWLRTVEDSMHARTVSYEPVLLGPRWSSGGRMVVTTKSGLFKIEAAADLKLHPPLKDPRDVKTMLAKLLQPWEGHEFAQVCTGKTVIVVPGSGELSRVGKVVRARATRGHIVDKVQVRLADSHGAEEFPADVVKPAPEGLHIAPPAVSEGGAGRAPLHSAVPENAKLRWVAMRGGTWEPMFVVEELKGRWGGVAHYIMRDRLARYRYISAQSTATQLPPHADPADAVSKLADAWQSAFASSSVRKGKEVLVKHDGRWRVFKVTNWGKHESHVRKVHLEEILKKRSGLTGLVSTYVYDGRKAARRTASVNDLNAVLVLGDGPAALATDVHHASEGVDALERQLQDTQGQLQEKQRHSDRAAREGQRRLDGVKQELASARAQLVHVRADLQRREAKVEQQQDALRRREATIKDLRAKRAEDEQQLRTLRGQADDDAQRLTQLDRYKHELKRMQEECSTLRLRVHEMSGLTRLDQSKFPEVREIQAAFGFVFEQSYNEAYKKIKKVLAKQARLEKHEAWEAARRFLWTLVHSAHEHCVGRRDAMLDSLGASLGIDEEQRAAVVQNILGKYVQDNHGAILASWRDVAARHVRGSAALPVEVDSDVERRVAAFVDDSLLVTWQMALAKPELGLTPSREAFEGAPRERMEAERHEAAFGSKGEGVKYYVWPSVVLQGTGARLTRARVFCVPREPTPPPTPSPEPVEPAPQVAGPEEPAAPRMTGGASSDPAATAEVDVDRPDEAGLPAGGAGTPPAVLDAREDGTGSDYTCADGPPATPPAEATMGRWHEMTPAACGMMDVDCPADTLGGGDGGCMYADEPMEAAYHAWPRAEEEHVGYAEDPPANASAATAWRGDSPDEHWRADDATDNSWRTGRGDGGYGDDV